MFGALQFLYSSFHIFARVRSWPSCPVSLQLFIVSSKSSSDEGKTGHILHLPKARAWFCQSKGREKSKADGILTWFTTHPKGGGAYGAAGIQGEYCPQFRSTPSGNPMSGTSGPETTTTVSDVNAGLVHGAIHDRGHDHHKKEAKTKTAVMRQWSRFPRRASWWSESCNGSSVPILSSASDAVSLALAIPVRSSSDARGYCTGQVQVQQSPLGLVTVTLRGTDGQ